MASYRGHVALSIPLGIAFGGVAVWQFGIDIGTAAYAGTLTAAGGLLPDLDSDSGVPVRILFGIASVLVPLLMIRKLLAMESSIEMVVIILVGVHLLIRYGISALFKEITVHRGMFHSVPAMLIAGLVVFLLYDHKSPWARGYLACGVMLGFFSHLLLDELCSIDLMGAKIRLNKSAGSAMKFFSSSWIATLATYLLLMILGAIAALEFEGPRSTWRDWQQRAMRIEAFK